MNSCDKVRALAHDWMTREPNGFQEAAILLLAQQLGPQLLEQLPDDPAQLDELISKIAGHVLDLRSDDAIRIELRGIGAEPVGAVAENARFAALANEPVEETS